MNAQYTLTLLVMLAVLIASIFYLLRMLTHHRQLISLVGLFFMAMGMFLLVLDLVLISFTQGPQYILDYLLFNRLVSDTGFSGRWMLTVYVFLGTGLVISIYLLARNLITKLNKMKTGGKF